MKNRYGFFCVCALLEVISLPCPAQVLETNAATGTSFYIENDVLSRTHKGDKWYTNGVRAVHLGDPKAYDIPADLATKLALFLCDYTFNCDPKQEKSARILASHSARRFIRRPTLLNPGHNHSIAPGPAGCTLAVSRNLRLATVNQHQESRHSKLWSSTLAPSARKHSLSRRKNLYIGSSIHNSHKDGITK